MSAARATRLALALLLATTAARADPVLVRPRLGHTYEWIGLGSVGLAVGTQGGGVLSGVETAVRAGHFLLGADLAVDVSSLHGRRDEAGVWAGYTTDGPTRWEFGAGGGWHHYAGVGERLARGCGEADPGAAGSTAYLGQRVGVRWNGPGRATWTMGLWLYAAEDLTRQTVAYAYTTVDCGAPFAASTSTTHLASAVVGDFTVGVALRFGFSLGE